MTQKISKMILFLFAFAVISIQFTNCSEGGMYTYPDNTDYSSSCLGDSCVKGEASSEMLYLQVAGDVEELAVPAYPLEIHMLGNCHDGNYADNDIYMQLVDEVTGQIRYQKAVTQCEDQRFEFVVEAPLDYSQFGFRNPHALVLEIFGYDKKGNRYSNSVYSRRIVRLVYK